MSKEQIEEMAKVIDEYTEPLSARDIHKAEFSEQFAKHLYTAGYRKQSEGEWIITNENGFWHYECPFCDDGYAQETKLPTSNYCANCGARLTEPKMKGGAE